MPDFSDKQEDTLSEYCLVLGGGGARGAFEIGVWKALREIGISFHAAAGTSVGALNAAFVAQDDFDAAVELYSTVTLKNIVNIPDEYLKDGLINRDLQNLSRLSSFLLASRGLDTTPLKKLINHYLDEDKLRRSHIDFALVTYDVSNLRPRRFFIEDIPRGRLNEFLLASASHPIFRAATIDKARLTDGGVADNMPFNMMRERGYRKIITVDLSGMGRTLKPQIVNTDTIYIKNSQRLAGAMDVTPRNTMHAFNLGYLDTLRTLEKIEGIRYFIRRDTREFKRIEAALTRPEVLPRLRSAAAGIHSRAADTASEGPQIIRGLLPRENATYRYIAVPLVECAALCLDIPRDSLYSMEELIDRIKRGMGPLKTTEPFERKESLKGTIKRLRAELDALKTEGIFKLPAARYASALRTVMGRDDRNFSIRMLQPLFPELPAAHLLLQLLREESDFFY